MSRLAMLQFLLRLIPVRWKAFRAHVRHWGPVECGPEGWRVNTGPIHSHTEAVNELVVVYASGTPVKVWVTKSADAKSMLTVRWPDGYSWRFRWDGVQWRYDPFNL